ncbi:MAG: hypothetical protein GF364_04140 [Candidatus Lokiarchaeota archaeon]|nr:hypothetical protein [Candidatus Lokiarchaeota archaeon]
MKNNIFSDYKYNKIIGKYYIEGLIKTITPIKIGNGEENNSDDDLIRDWDNIPFIPGTTIAGILRHYVSNIIDENENTKNILNLFFGFDSIKLSKLGNMKNSEDQEISTKSMAVFYDAFPIIKETQNITNHITIRDNVKIDNETGIAVDNSKFDYEILEPPCTFKLRIEITIRDIINHLSLFLENNQNTVTNNENIHIKYIEDFIFLILEGFQNNKIRVGSKTTRGFGKVSLEDLKIHRFRVYDNKEDSDVTNTIEKMINFQWDTNNDSKYRIKVEKLHHNVIPLKKKRDIMIEAEFIVPYSILIRSLNPNPNEEDYQHLSYKYNEQGIEESRAIISGTSWSGALKASIENIGDEIGKKDYIYNKVKKIFGYNDGARTYKSRISINESIIFSNNKMLEYTRNKIDRFTSGTIDGALFTEKPSFEGRVKLEISFLSTVEDYEIGLIILGLMDLTNGIQPIGGANSIGRGILKGKNLIISFWDLENRQKRKEIKIEDFYNMPLEDGTNWSELTPYIKNLANELNKNTF